MADYTLKNLKEDVEDSAVQFGLSPALEARFAREPLELQNSGASYLRLSPGDRMPWGHTHKQQEEVYVVVGGSGRIKLDDEVVELRKWDGLVHDLAVHAPDQVDAERRILVGEVGAVVCAARLAANEGAFERRSCREQRPVEVERVCEVGVARDVRPDLESTGAFANLVQPAKSLRETSLGAHDAAALGHEIAKRPLQRPRELLPPTGEHRVDLLAGLVDGRAVTNLHVEVCGRARRRSPDDPTEDEALGERVAAETVRAVDTRSALADGKEPRDVGFVRLRVDAHAAHRVMGRRRDLHRRRRDVVHREVDELPIHARQ